MRVGICTAAIVLASVATVAAEVVNVMPASCRRRETLDAAEYQRMWRFLPLGGGYRMWAEKDCYPYRVAEAALASVERPVGTIVDIGGRDVFVVDLDPVWFRRCTKTATPVTGNIAVDGPTLLFLDPHVAARAGTARASRSVDFQGSAAQSGPASPAPRRRSFPRLRGPAAPVLVGRRGGDGPARRVRAHPGSDQSHRRGSPGCTGSPHA